MTNISHGRNMENIQFQFLEQGVSFCLYLQGIKAVETLDH